MGTRHRATGGWLAAATTAATTAVAALVAGGYAGGYAGAAVTSSPGAGRISTIAGGVGGPERATMVAMLACGVAAKGGQVYAADLAGSLREVDARTDWLRPVAGKGFGQAYSGDGGPAIKAGLDDPCGLAVGPAGNLAIADVWRIRMIAGRSGTFFGQAMTAGDIYTVAGNGQCCASLGNGGPATSAEVQVASSAGVAFDRWGNLVLADERQDTVRVVAARSGTFYGQAMAVGHIYPVAGNGLGAAFYGDGGPARNAGMYLVIGSGLAADGAGDLAISDLGNYRVRVVAQRNGTFFGVRMKAGRIYTVAGTGLCCSADPGASGPAASAMLAPSGLAFDRSGNLLVDDQYGNRLLVLPVRGGRFYGRPMKAGYIYPLAYGRGGGNGAPASKAGLGGLTSVAVDAAGNLVVSGDFRLRVLAEHSGFYYGRRMTAGRVYNVAGNGLYTSGDGGPATAAEIAGPLSVATDRAGDIAMLAAISDSIFSVRLVAARAAVLFGQTMKKGDIYTIARPQDARTVVIDSAGNVLYTDPALSQVVAIAVRSGRFYGQDMKAGGSYPVLKTATPDPFLAGLALDRFGGMAFGDGVKVRLRAARTGTFFGRAMTAGRVYVLAGGSRVGYSGDGGPAVGAEIYGDQIGIDRAGNLLLADTNNNRIRVVARQSGTYYGLAMTAGHIYTVAGDGAAGFSGDGGPAPSAEISGGVAGIAADGAGNLLIADSGNNRIRVLAAATGTFYGVPMIAGDIYSVAGSAVAGFSGDGGPATSATLNDPRCVATTPNGDLLICDASNVRLRMVIG